MDIVGHFSGLEGYVAHLFDQRLFRLIAELFIIGISTFYLSHLSSRVMKYLKKRFNRTHMVWNEAVIMALSKPIYMTIWVFGLCLLIEAAGDYIRGDRLIYIKPLKSASVIFAISWFVFGMIEQVEKHWNTQIKKGASKLDKTAAGAFAKIMKISTVVLAMMIALETFGFSISGILAFAGGGGVAIGFASKDLLANLFGAFMIYLDKPFKVGDWIQLPEKDVEGYVENIGLRCTVIRTLDKRPLYVPNSFFPSVPIENISRMSHRKIYETISLRHEDAHVVDAITKDIYKMLLKHKGIDRKQMLAVNVSGFNLSSIDIIILAFTKFIETEEFYQTKHEMLLKAMKIIDKFEAKLAYNAWQTTPNSDTKEHYSK